MAFYTKDVELINSLTKSSESILDIGAEKKIPPLFASLYDGREVIEKTALDFMNESDVVYTLGLIDALNFPRFCGH